MGLIRMTIDPSFSHRVVEILKEKLWDGDIDGINRFMEDGFGITNPIITADVLSGRRVMVFGEDGGSIVSREDLTTDEAEAMCGVPDSMTVKDIREAIRIRMIGQNGLLERQKFVIKNFPDVLDVNKIHTVDLNSCVLQSDVLKLIHSDRHDTMISTLLTTKEIIGIYAASKNNETSRDMVDNIKESGQYNDVSRLIYIMEEVDRIAHSQNALTKAMDYIGDYIFEDVRNIDMYNDNGIKASEDEITEDPGRYCWMQDFFERCTEINEYYRFIFADPAEQDILAENALANQPIIHAAFRGGSETESMLDTYIKSELSERPTGPAKPTDDQWDAGWISPEGAFWAGKGCKANFIHLNLADDIQKYYSDSLEWLNNTENPDRELERHGWLKFHGSEISYAGYEDMNIGRHIPITNRQIDKLRDYAKHMGYKVLRVASTKKHIDVSGMYEYTNDEWRDLFEW